MLRKLVKTVRIELDVDDSHAGPAIHVRYFEQRTARGGRRYSSEMLLGANDRIILDDDTMSGLESKVDRLVPAVVYSRTLAARTGMAAA